MTKHQITLQEDFFLGLKDDIKVVEGLQKVHLMTEDEKKRFMARIPKERVDQILTIVNENRPQLSHSDDIEALIKLIDDTDDLKMALKLCIAYNLIPSSREFKWALSSGNVEYIINLLSDDEYRNRIISALSSYEPLELDSACKSLKDAMNIEEQINFITKLLDEDAQKLALVFFKNGFSSNLSIRQRLMAYDQVATNMAIESFLNIEKTPSISDLHNIMSICQEKSDLSQEKLNQILQSVVKYALWFPCDSAHSAYDELRKTLVLETIDLLVSKGADPNATMNAQMISISSLVGHELTVFEYITLAGGFARYSTSPMCVDMIKSLYQKGGRVRDNQFESFKESIADLIGGRQGDKDFTLRAKKIILFELMEFGYIDKVDEETATNILHAVMDITKYIDGRWPNNELHRYWGYTEDQLRDIIVKPLLKVVDWNRFANMAPESLVDNKLSLFVYKNAIAARTQIPISIISIFPEDKIRNIQDTTMMRKVRFLEKMDKIEKLHAQHLSNFFYRDCTAELQSKLDEIQQFTECRGLELQELVQRKTEIANKIGSKEVLMHAIKDAFTSLSDIDKVKIYHEVQLQGEKLLRSRNIKASVDSMAMLEMFTKAGALEKLGKAYELWDEGGVLNVIKAATMALSLAIHSRGVRHLWSIVVCEMLTPKDSRVKAIGDAISRLCASDPEQGKINLAAVFAERENHQNPYVAYVLRNKVCDDLSFAATDLNNKIIDGFSFKNIKFIENAKLTNCEIANSDFSGVNWGGDNPDLSNTQIDSQSLATMKTLPAETITTGAVLTDLNLKSSDILNIKPLAAIITNSLAMKMGNNEQATILFEGLKTACANDTITQKYFSYINRATKEQLVSIAQELQADTKDVSALLNAKLAANVVGSVAQAYTRGAGVIETKAR